MSGKSKVPAPHLPAEIVEIIVDYLHDDKKSLTACSLVAHNWLIPSRYHLISSITVTINTAQPLLTLLNSPHSTVTSSVRELKFVPANKHTGQDIGFILFNFTERLARLNSLVFMYASWAHIDLHSLNHLRTFNITKLVMCGCTFESNAQFFDIVSLFQVLEEFTYLSISEMRTNRPYLYASTISPRLRKLSVVNEQHIPLELTHWLTRRSLPLLQDIALEEISCFSDVQIAASLIAHTGPTLTNLHIALTRGYVLLLDSQPFLDLNCCPSLRTLSISLNIANERSLVNISFLPIFIASATSSSLRKIRLVLRVDQTAERYLRYIPWQDIDTVFASNSSFALLEKVVIQLHPGYIFDDPVSRGNAELFIYRGLERIARLGKLDVQYIREIGSEYRFMNMHRAIHRHL